MIQLRFQSQLAAPPERVLAHALTMRGVNAELMPLLRMTCPAQAQAMTIDQAPVGEVLFHSWLLLLCVLPVDRHALRLERLLPGVGFDERSSSWLQRVWIHRRRIEAARGGTCITDELQFEPRLRWLAPLLAPVVTTIFSHRHRRLRRLFGTTDGG